MDRPKLTLKAFRDLGTPEAKHQFAIEEDAAARQRIRDEASIGDAPTPPKELRYGVLNGSLHPKGITPDRWEELSNGQYVKLVVETRPLHPKRVLRVELYADDQKTKLAVFHRQKRF